MIFKENPILRYLIIYIIIFMTVIVFDYIFSSEIDLVKAFFGSLLIVFLSAALNHNGKKINEK